MREKYESLSLVVLKDLAKARGLKGISTMKKGELIDRMLQEDEREKEAAPKAKTVYTARTASGQEGRKHTPKPRREEHSSHTEDHSHPEHGESMHAEHGAHASQATAIRLPRNRSIRHRRIMTVLRSKKISSASTVEIQRAVFWRLWQTDSVLSAVKTICRGNMTFMWRRPRSADLI